MTLVNPYHPPNVNDSQRRIAKFRQDAPHYHAPPPRQNRAWKLIRRLAALIRGRGRE